MRLEQEPGAPLIRRASAAIDIPTTGLVFALIGVAVAVLVFGAMPTVIAIGLLALLVVD